jgi:hypothetical protein
MSFRRAVETTGTLTLLFATAALIATGCGGGSSGGNGTGGTPGTGGHGTGGHVGVGGAPGTAGSGMGGSAVMPTCTPLPATTALLTDFSDPTMTGFGDNSTTLTGIISMFDGSAVNVATGAWTIDQEVTGYGNTGARIDFGGCPKADLSAYTGIQFDIAGQVTPPAAGGPDAGPLPPQQISLQVVTAQDSVASNFDAQNSYAATFGTCVPTGGNQYDGTCTTPSVNVPIASGTPVTKSFLWTQIAGGKGQPGGRATPDPSQILGFAFIFPYNGVVPFHITLTIDNIRLTTGSGTTTDSGTSTDTATPPADAATD